MYNYMWLLVTFRLRIIYHISNHNTYNFDYDSDRLLWIKVSCSCLTNVYIESTEFKCNDTVERMGSNASYCFLLKALDSVQSLRALSVLQILTLESSATAHKWLPIVLRHWLGSIHAICVLVSSAERGVNLLSRVLGAPRARAPSANNRKRLE